MASTQVKKYPFIKVILLFAIQAMIQENFRKEELEEQNMLGLPVSLNKKTKGRMLMLDSRVENWKKPSVIYLSVWIVLGDLFIDSHIHF